MGGGGRLGETTPSNIIKPGNGQVSNSRGYHELIPTSIQCLLMIRPPIMLINNILRQYLVHAVQLASYLYRSPTKVNCSKLNFGLLLLLLPTPLGTGISSLLFSVSLLQL
jgi:hypothetical protein